MSLLDLIPGDIVGKAMEFIDKKWTTKAEKEEARRAFELEATARIEEALAVEVKAITERHKNDMMSDSWLSKNIRPLGLMFFSAIYLYQTSQGMSEFIIETTAGLLGAYVMFYVGSRGIEKATKIYSDRRNK